MAEPITEALDHIVDFSAIDGVSCPCGTSRRAFTDLADFPATIHQVEISSDAKLHYHKHQTEAYYFLRCEEGAKIQLDDQLIDVKAGMCVVIRPGVRHRAVGKMTVLNVVMPKFDPQDEWFD